MNAPAVTTDLRFRIASFNRTSSCTVALVFLGIYASTVTLLDGNTRIVALAIATAVLLLILGHMAFASVRIGEDGLQIGSGLYRKRIAKSDLVSVESAASTPLGWRTNGIGFPGFALGWFSGGGRRLFVAAGTRRHAMRLRLRGNFDVVVAVTDPVGLQRALHDMRRAD
jgi:hypothetical protein